MATSFGSNPNQELIEEIKQKHSDYSAYVKDWLFYGLSYEGGKPFIDHAMTQHERESDKNFMKRKADAVYVNFSKEIIDIFNFYLTEKPVLRVLGKLDNHNLWTLFKDDCDLEGTDFNVFMNNIETLAAIYGSVGILVDKPKGYGEAVMTRDDEIKNKIYPYCSVYTRPNVWDWKYVRDQVTGRRVLNYLKLYEEDGTIMRWYPDHWERWKFIVDEKGKETVSKIDEDQNRIGEISFVWLENIKHTSVKDIGISDIVEIARVATSIMKNFSNGEEVIELAAFPILLEPWDPDDSDIPGSGGDQSEIGPRVVKGFDPENPQAKAEWLKSEVGEPIAAVLKWIEKKVDLIFQMAHLSGVHSVEKSKEARSAVALRLEFNQLWSVLSKKAENLNEAERKIIYYWLLWQNEQELYSQVDISRSKDFSVDDLSQSLYNLKESLKMVLSKKYNKLVQKQIVKIVMPDITPKDVEIIYQEIDTNEKLITVEQDLGKKDSRQVGLGKPEIKKLEGPPDISDEVKQGL